MNLKHVAAHLESDENDEKTADTLTSQDVLYSVDHICTVVKNALRGMVEDQGRTCRWFNSVRWRIRRIELADVAVVHRVRCVPLGSEIRVEACASTCNMDLE